MPMPPPMASHHNNVITNPATQSNLAIPAAVVPMAPHDGNVATNPVVSQGFPSVHTHTERIDVTKPAPGLKVPQIGSQQKPDSTWDNTNGAASSSLAKKDESKPAPAPAPAPVGSKPVAEPVKPASVEMKVPVSAMNGSAEEAKAGEKRKADEIATTTTTKAPEPAAAVSNDTKKQKTATSTAEGKKGPGRPKGGNGAKREKKVPRAGTAARKTRSQGKAD